MYARTTFEGRAKKGIPTRALLFLSCMLMLSFVLHAGVPAQKACAATGEIVRCSTSSSAAQANGHSYYPSCSDDARYVAFHSAASDLITADSNGASDVFRKDLTTGEVLCCSTDSSGSQGNYSSYYAVISSDGRYVAFQSNANNLVPGDSNGRTDVFRKDLLTGAIVLCSADSSGLQGNGNSRYPSLNSDGKYVAFESIASNLVAGDTNGDSDIFRKDNDTGAVVVCSTDASGTPGTSDSYRPAMSADGGYVVFSSNARLVPRAYESNLLKVYRKDLSSGDILCCSCSDSGELAAGYCSYPCTSSDGRYVFFQSNGENLIAGDTNAAYDIFRKDPGHETPGIQSLDPVSGFQGARITINGGLFGAIQGSSYVTFDSTQVTEYVSWSDTEIVVDAPLGMAGDLNVRVTNTLGTSNARTFTISPPLLQSVDPTYGYSGKEVRLRGSYFGLIQGSSYVSFGSVNVAQYTSWSDTEIYCTVPAGIMGEVDVTVTTLNGTSSALTFDVGPHVDSARPNYGRVGAEVTIYGYNFGPAQGTSYVSFGAVKATQYSQWSDTQIICTVPPAAYETNLKVTTAGGTSNSLPYYLSPTLESIDPVVAAIGEEVRLYGSAFGPNRGSGYVSFGGVRVSEYIAWTNTEIRVRVPRGISGQVSVVVTANGGGNSDAVAFTVQRYAVGFAEGYTGEGFQQYLCIGNANDYPAEVEIWYLFPDSTYLDDYLTVPAASRATLDVNDYINPYFEHGSEVSVIVFSDLEVVVERPIYFSYQGRWTDGHNVVGTPYVSKLWFFAEGYTGWGFDEYICVLNPTGEPANLTFHFQTEEAGEIDRTESVPPASRRTFKVNELLGSDYQCSLVLESDQLVVAERPMYFDYTGLGNHHWEGGHCVIGLPYLDQEYYFAEGTTRSGFEEWLTIQNPFSEAITVIATYQLGEGQGTPVIKSYVIPPERRYTVNVSEEVGKEKDVSVKLASSSYFLAERPMYFRYGGYGASWEGGHCIIGASELSSEWFFAEGCTADGFQEWLCLQNTGEEDAEIQILYLGRAGILAAKQVTVPAKTRKTLRVNDEAGSGLELSCSLRVLSGPPVMVERPMYFDYHGCDGGHDVVGYCPEPFGISSSYGGAEHEQGALLRDHAWEPGRKRRD